MFGRLALKRWGDVEKIQPSAPTDLQIKILPTGNGVKLDWKSSSDASGIYAYRVYVDDALAYCTDQPEIVLSDFAWNQNLKIAVQAVDAWQNVSAKVEKTVRLGERPAHMVLLKDLKSSSALFDDAPMDILTDHYTASDKSNQPVTYLVDGYEPNPIPRYVRKTAAHGFGIRVKPSFKQGVLTYALEQKYTRLLLNVGMLNSSWETVQLKIIIDDTEILVTKPFDYETRNRAIGRKPEVVDIDVSKAKVLRFEITVVSNKNWEEDAVVFGSAMLMAK